MKPPLTEQDYINAADRLGVEVATIKAVAEVESGPYGAFLPTGEPVILFERHLFHRLTRGKWTVYSQRVPDGTKDERLVFPYADISNPKPGGYGKVSEQHARLQRAVALDRAAALQSASWGRFQVLGLNWESLEYDNLQEFVNRMYRSEADHLDSFVRFVEVNGLAKYLRAKQWAKFARGYNGPSFAKYDYDSKLALAYRKYSK